MNAPAKLGAFAVGLVAVFGAAVGLGALLGPVDAVQAANGHGGEPGAGSEHAGGGDVESHAPEAKRSEDEIPGGLMVSARGYTLAPAQRDFEAGVATPVSFRILGPGGEAVTAYDESHEEDLHLIAVRRDMTGFQHVHPEMAPDGTWSTPLFLEPGEWRLFADFDPAGPDSAVTLGADVSVAGDYTPRPLPQPEDTAEVDAYTVTLDGELVPGQESEVTLSVSRNGRPVTDLQPYLAAYGHLVALRDGDLAYLHVHPSGEPGDGRTQPGPEVSFYVTVPSTGDYRLFLDFRHEGAVRTAEFTARAGDLGSGVPTTRPEPADGHADDGHGG